MGLSCGARALKFCLFLFNLAFVICGLVCVILGVWLILDRYAVDNLALAISHVKGIQQHQDDGLNELASKPTAVRQIGYLLLFGGIAVIFVASLGCCGAAKEWRPLLCCYASCLMLILAIEIAAGIYAAMHSHMFDKDFRQILRASLKLYNGTDTPTTLLSDEKTTITTTTNSRSSTDAMLVKTAWDKLMQEKACCGVDSRLGEFSQSGCTTLLFSQRREFFNGRVGNTKLIVCFGRTEANESQTPNSIIPQGSDGEFYKLITLKAVPHFEQSNTLSNSVSEGRMKEPNDESLFLL
uniref:Uncharacterized protein n=1 Tax=Meloidogyne enterolobii TaxID=390850 RepID=A0A6V7WVE4_MELEN|nr:unnamed protein product [Meloidogyne enterolobii]